MTVLVHDDLRWCPATAGGHGPVLNDISMSRVLTLDVSKLTRRVGERLTRTGSCTGRRRSPGCTPRLARGRTGAVYSARKCSNRCLQPGSARHRVAGTRKVSAGMAHLAFGATAAVGQVCGCCPCGPTSRAVTCLSGWLLLTIVFILCHAARAGDPLSTPPGPPPPPAGAARF